MGNGTGHVTDRDQLEKLLSADLRELTSESDWIARTFAEQNDVSANEFRALLFVMIAENRGDRLTSGDLRKRMGLSGAAITYLVERMVGSGHLRREADPTDRRKVILRYGEHGWEVARTFFTSLALHSHGAMAELPDADLEAAHRAYAAMIDAMRGFRAELASNLGPASPLPSPARVGPT